MESRHDLEVLRRGCMQSRLLVESLLHHAAAADRPLRIRLVALQALVGDCVALLEPEIRARRVSVEIGELPVVRAEPPLIGAVMSNLLVNALKYGPRGSATIRIGAERDGAAWRVHVESEGEPIPPEDRERIFRPRTRGRGERRARGCGLGLTICREIVERHGGRDRCRARRGRDRQPLRVHAPGRAARVGSAASPPGSTGSRCRIPPTPSGGCSSSRASSTSSRRCCPARSGCTSGSSASAAARCRR